MLRPAKREIRMIIGMVADFVAFIHDPAHQPGITFRVCSRHEKCRRRFCRLEDIENLRCPAPVRPVIECDCDLMFTTRALMIKRRKLGKLHVLGGEITFRVRHQVAQTVRTALIHRNNFAVTDVSNRVGASQDLEQFARLIVDLEVARNVERIPNRRVLGAEPVKCKPAGLLLSNFAQLVQERRHI